MTVTEKSPLFRLVLPKSSEFRVRTSSKKKEEMKAGSWSASTYEVSNVAIFVELVRTQQSSVLIVDLQIDLDRHTITSP